jgi:hypothetical protein
MGFDFDSTESFDITNAAGQILKTGNYVAKITKAEGGKSSGGHPQLELQLEAPEGEVRDWIIYNNGFGQKKLKGLMTKLGLNPTQEQKDEMATTGLLPDALVSVFAGKTVGIQVREEPSYKDPSKLRSTVHAYGTPAEIQAADAPPPPVAVTAPADDWAGTTPASAGFAAPGADDDIPF